MQTVETARLFVMMDFPFQILAAHQRLGQSRGSKGNPAHGVKPQSCLQIQNRGMEALIGCIVGSAQESVVGHKDGHHLYMNPFSAFHT